ncbi:MAG: hypothetical protein NTZ60_09785 [Campylobacterales bacterium]|nr:hypothetical protein [Campylobacterales bacterium]
MTLQELRLTLEIGCVMDQDIEYLVGFGKQNGIDPDEIDDELVKLGYDKIFENQFEDDYDDDDAFGYIQKFPNKSKFYED